MFKKSKRINSREFTTVFKKGKKSFSSFFQIITFGGECKVAVVISKKKIKKRIQRNREKRRILHVIKKITEQYPLSTNMIIFLQKDTQNLTFNELEEELLYSIKK